MRPSSGMFSLRLTRPDSSAATAITVFVGLLVHLKHSSGVAGISLAPVFWNLTNPIFKTSKNDHIIVVNLFDEIDFICPHYPSTVSDAAALLEYYLIYRVSKKEYDECNIYSDNTSFLILRCSHPRQKRRFTILFEPFQSIPNVPEYKAGHTYYFMTPSTGRKNGLRNLYQGACLQHNMKLTIKVRDGDYDEEEIPLKRTDGDEGEAMKQDDELIIMEYQSQEAVNGFLPSTNAVSRRHHVGLTPPTLQEPSEDDPAIQRTTEDSNKRKHNDMSHSVPEHSASIEDVEDNLDSFLKSGSELPPSGQTGSHSVSNHRPSTATLMLPTIAVSTVAFARWRFVSVTAAAH